MSKEFVWIIIRSEENNPMIISFDYNLRNAMIESRIRDSNQKLIKIPILQENTAIRCGNIPYNIEISTTILSLSSYDHLKTQYYKLSKTSDLDLDTKFSETEFVKHEEDGGQLIFTRRLKTEVLKNIFVVMRKNKSQIDYGVYSVFSVNNSLLIKYKFRNEQTDFLILTKYEHNSLVGFSFDKDMNQQKVVLTS